MSPPFDGPYWLRRIEFAHEGYVPVGELRIRYCRPTSGAVESCNSWVVAVVDEDCRCIIDAYRTIGLAGRPQAAQWLLDLANARRA